MTASTLNRTRGLALLAGFILMAALALPAARAGESAAEETLLTAAIPAVDGPKRTVAVAPFGATSAFAAEYGFTDVGGGMAAMLATALVESRQFLVVERAQLSTVLAEQELGANAMTTPESGVQPGALLGAQLLIVGEVTEFSDADKGRGFGLGLNLSGKQLGLSPQSKTGTVGLDVRVIDTSNGRIVAAFQVREQMKSRSVAVNVGYKGRSAGISDFLRTPIGQAARSAINQVVQQFAAVAASQPWSGSVVEADRRTLVINAGADSGVKVGDRFTIRRVAKVLTDPSSGRVLGRRTEILGFATIEEVGDSLAYANFMPVFGSTATRGDLVISGT
ncbi:MAG: CsgG/HfaB family protein [Gammaproteobacteria bacterium]